MGGLSCKASANCFKIPLKKQQQQLWGRVTQSCAEGQQEFSEFLEVNDDWDGELVCAAEATEPRWV